MPNLWYQRYPLRISAEQAIMREMYPQFILKIDDQRLLFWDGILKTNFNTHYQVNIHYPQAYPWEKPKLFIVDPALHQDAPHRYLDGALCIYPVNWNHKQATAPAAVPLVAAWLAMYELFIRTGERW